MILRFDTTTDRYFEWYWFKFLQVKFCI